MNRLLTILVIEHVLHAVPCFVHPTNGNMYGVVIEKIGGVRQDLSVYRTRPGSTHRELVKRYIGGQDSRAQIAAGGCVILQDGTLEVWATAVPPLQPNVTDTGFQGVWDRVPGVDAPWSSGGAQGPMGPAGPAGAGSVTLFDTPRTSTAWQGRTVSAGESVDIPAVFGAPSATAYLIRFAAVATAANVRIRAGTQAAPYFLTLNTQYPTSKCIRKAGRRGRSASSQRSMARRKSGCTCSEPDSSNARRSRGSAGVALGWRVLPDRMRLPIRGRGRAQAGAENRTRL